MTDTATSNNSPVHEPWLKKANNGGSVFPSITLTDYFITKENLTPGFAGTRQTLAAMAALVRGEYPPDFIGYQSEPIRRAALYICQQSPGHNFQSEIESLFVYVRDAITYRLDPVNTERLQDAQQTINTGAGDCDDKCILLASLLPCYACLFIVAIALSISG
jgi:transglutaminase-like putative cysteine protease